MQIHLYIKTYMQIHLYIHTYMHIHLYMYMFDSYSHKLINKLSSHKYKQRFDVWPLRTIKQTIERLSRDDIKFILTCYVFMMSNFFILGIYVLHTLHGLKLYRNPSLNSRTISFQHCSTRVPWLISCHYSTIEFLVYDISLCVFLIRSWQMLQECHYISWYKLFKATSINGRHESLNIIWMD
jgi:hypothetical protein